MTRIEAARQNGKRGGRPLGPLSYDLSILNIGDRVFVPWRTDAKSVRLASQQAIYKTLKRAPGTFSTLPLPAGLIVTRRG